MNENNDILDNGFSATARALLKSTVGKTLVSWSDDSDPSPDGTTAAFQVVRFDFDGLHLCAKTSPWDPPSDATSHVNRTEIFDEPVWRALVEANPDDVDKGYVPAEWKTHPVGRTVTAVTLFTDVATNWHRHDDGHLTVTRDACAVAFHFDGGVLVAEKKNAWSDFWQVGIQTASEPRLRGERAPGALVAERL